MILKILAIGDVGNYIKTLSKFTKKSKIHIINFPKDGAGIYTYDEDVELFESYKVTKQIKKINKIKDQYDLCIVMGTGERIAYLSDLNYIAYYVGRDVDAPRFVKNSKEEWNEEPLHTLNIFERLFYKLAFKNAVAHVASLWVFDHLRKFTKNGIRMDRKAIDPTIFKDDEKTLEKKKEKFTFFCPQRIERFKGTDLLWNALSLCKADFEIHQVEWFGETNEEEKEFKKKMLANVPPQIKFIPMIKRKEMRSYYDFADAVIGNMYLGFYEYVEIEGVFCKKPVISYANPNKKILSNDKFVDSPFLPHRNDPRSIAEIIDKIVSSEEFRNKLLEEECKFVSEISDPQKSADWWDDLFIKVHNQHEGIRKNSSFINQKLRIILFLIANRLYLEKIRKIKLSSS